MYTSFRHACIVLPKFTNHLTQYCFFPTSCPPFYRQTNWNIISGYTDRMMSGFNYHISYLEILETERRLKLSNILKIFAGQQDTSLQSIKSFVKSFSSSDSTCEASGEFT